MDIFLFLPGVLLLFVLLPAIVLAALWDFTAFIIFLATLRSAEEKHKKAENMFIRSSAILTVGIVLAAVCYLLMMLVEHFI
ncbi:MAG: hypothetical protein K2K57_11740 [Oscillospiraceae bacterium]|nr:hypothetical protein [Oscillospiraceae bacterium]